MAEPDSHDAYNKTEQGLARLQGLARAAHQLAMNHPVMGSSDPSFSAIVSLLTSIEQKA